MAQSARRASARPELLATYEGPGADGTIVEIMGARPARGPYVIIQMDLSDVRQPLNLLEVQAIGSQGSQLFIVLLKLVNMVSVFMLHNSRFKKDILFQL